MELNRKELNYCNNCGLTGHTYNYCKQPILSFGILAYKIIDKEIRYLMICRKDSLGFVDFVRGKYPIYSAGYIQGLVDEMTNTEKDILLNSSFKEIWNYLWGPFNTLHYRSEDKHCREKFEQIKRGIKNNSKDSFNLEYLIKKSEVKWKSPEWGFPKGRKNFKEQEIKCAFREFQEETGYFKEDIDLITNIMPSEEIFMGSNYKVYKHKYYIGKFLGDIDIKNYQKSEVSDMKWLTYEECIDHIRCYNIEKKNMLNNVNQILHKYRLIS